ncbi:MAG: hypothetical protein ACT4PU_13600 [Planctomycetota bacterium]
MSFALFRKYEKHLLWVAVGLCLIVFVLFSGLGELKSLLEGRPSREQTAGEFVTVSTDETVHVSRRDFARARSLLNRMSERGVEEEHVWSHILLLADARAAGIDAADEEVAETITGWFGGQALTREQYDNAWRSMQFSSARELEEFVRERLIIARWQSYATEAATIVGAEDVYLRWRSDNELFDIEAVVVPDLSDEQLGDPGDDVLRPWFDAQPEAERQGRFNKPAQYDLAYGWLPLDAPAEEISDASLAVLPAPPHEDIDARFEALKAERWPDLSDPDEAAHTVLERELRLVALARSTDQAFSALPAESRTVGTFLETCRAAGFRTEDPATPLDPDAIKALPFGDEVLPLWLGTKQAGQTHAVQPFGQPTGSYLIFIESIVPSQPLEYAEAREQVLTAWRDERRSEPAKELRASLREATRALPEVAESLAPVLAEIQAAADAAAAGADEASRESLREQVLADLEQRDLHPRLVEHEHKLWDSLTLPAGAGRLRLDGLVRSYARRADGPEAADSVERFLKTSSAVFALAVNAISEPLRHTPSKSTVLVRILSRRFPEQAAMQADTEGYETSRQQLMAQRRREAQAQFEPQALMMSHRLQVAAPPTEAPAQ